MVSSGSTVFAIPVLIIQMAARRANANARNAADTIARVFTHPLSKISTRGGFPNGDELDAGRRVDRGSGKGRAAPHQKEAVTTALEEYVKMKRRLALLDLMGRIDYDPTYDYKDARRRGNRRAMIRLQPEGKCP